MFPSLKRLGLWARVLTVTLVLLFLIQGRPGVADDELDFGLEKRRVASVELAGNKAFDDARLKRLLPFQEPRWYLPFRSPSYDPDQLRLGLDAIRDFYRRHGYHAVAVEVDEVDTDGTLGDRIAIRVVEGAQTRIGDVTFRGRDLLPTRDLVDALAHPPDGPAPFRDADLGRDVFLLRNAFVERGYLSVQVNVTADRRPEAVDLAFDIEPGPVYTVREVTIEGNRDVADRLIRREVRLKPGDRFRLDAIARTEQNLFETGWFRDVAFTPTELDTTDATAAMLLRVVERPAAFWEVGVGAGDEDQLRLAGAWGHKNVFGSGRGLTLRARALWGVENIVALDKRELLFDHEEEVLYRHPRVLGTSFDLRMNAFFRQESRGELGLSLERTGLLANTTLFASRFSTTELEASIQRIRKLVLDKIPAEQRDEVPILGSPNAQTRSLSLVLTHDSRDDPFQPRRGSLRQAVLQSAGGPVIRGDNHFNKALAGWVKLFRLPGGMVLGLRAQAGWAAAWYRSADDGATGVPLEDRFFAGGSRSVRGYRENSLGPRISAADSSAAGDVDILANRPAAGGNAMLLTTAELRFPIPLLSKVGLGGAVFLDGGNVWDSWSDVSIRQFELTSDAQGDDPTSVQDYRTSIGLGFHYNTPVGPLRLEYALPLRRAALRGETDTVEVDPHHLWHFSLGHAF